MFTYNYSQPEEYRFSIDSVAAPSFAAEKNKREGFTPQRILDLCSGCGVMGFEYFFRHPTAREIMFLDVQEIYQGHFSENKRQVLSDVRWREAWHHQQNLIGATGKEEILSEPHFHFERMNYRELRTIPNCSGYFDLILCNPPYFQLSQGKTSENEFKRRCRFFVDATFPELIESVLFSLAKNGRAYILMRDLQDHGWSMKAELWRIIAGSAKSEEVEDIRGTSLLLVTKN